MVELEQIVDQELPEEEVIVQPSIRESLASALSDVKEKQAIETAVPKEPKAPQEVKTGRERDETGKFQALKEPLKGKVVDKTAKVAPMVAEPEIKLPKTLSPALAAEWSKLPPVLQKEITKREEEFHRELTKHDEERVFGRQVKELSNPYIPLIKAEGGDLVKAFGSYLNTAYVLRTKSPQEKGRLLLQLAQEYGADLRGASQPQAQVDPRFTQLQQELHAMKSTLQQEQEAKKQQEETALKSQIDAFSADPAHPHFEAVKADMAALLRGGIVTTLQDAYDRAVYANPQTRSTLLQQQSVETEEKRLADKKARAEQARKAGSSLKGAPGIAATKNGKIVQPDLRSELRAQFAAFREG